MGQRSLNPSDRAEIDAVMGPMRATFSEMDEIFARSRLGHFIDMVEDGRELEAIALYGDGLADLHCSVDPDFDEVAS